MNYDDDYTLDLPVLLKTDDLPIPAPDAAPRHEVATPSSLQWLNIASQSHVRKLAVDPIRGDLWLATGGGVLRWWAGLDRFTRYASEHGLPGNSIKSVIVDGNGQPWAAHESAGISYLSGDTWQPYLFLEETPVSCLSVDETGQLWVGTGVGLYYVDAPTQEPTLVELPLHSTPPRSLAITTPDDIWLCTAQGVFHRQETWKRYNALPSILTIARQGNNLWIGTLDGLIRIDLITSKSYSVGESRTEVSALAPAMNGVWAACGKQVGFATETSWSPVRGKACDLVTSLAPATESPPDVIGVRSPNEPPTTFSNLVQSLAVQHLKNTSMLWIGTARGLFRIDLSTDTWRRIGKLGKQDIRAVTISEPGHNLWAASWLGNLYNEQQSSSLMSLPDASPITTLTAGLESSCWAGSLTGVYLHDGTAWTLGFPAKKLPGAAWVRAIAQTKLDCLWVGTSIGLFTYNPETKIVSPVSGILGTTHIQSLFALSTEQGTSLWIGTKRGLYHSQSEDFKPIPGLENRAITALTADIKNERLWVGTNRGLFCLSDAGGPWNISSEFTANITGLAHHQITALTIDTSKPDKTCLWIGTPCGLSVYNYESG
jgi:ligand-binding sensor domain-containing protein